MGGEKKKYIYILRYKLLGDCGLGGVGGGMGDGGGGGGGSARAYDSLRFASACVN